VQNAIFNTYVGPAYCRAKMYAGWPHRMLPLVSYGEYADCRRDRQTDGRTPDLYITLSVRRSQTWTAPTTPTLYKAAWTNVDVFTAYVEVF